MVQGKGLNTTSIVISITSQLYLRKGQQYVINYLDISI